MWSADPLRAAEVAEKLEAGTVWVNTHMQLTHDAPFTGMKWSGLGSEMGLWSIYAYTDPQTLYRTRAQSHQAGNERSTGSLVAPGDRASTTAAQQRTASTHRPPPPGSGRLCRLARTGRGGANRGQPPPFCGIFRILQNGGG